MEDISNSTYKKYSMAILITILLLYGFCAIVMYCLDPFQHYRKATFYKPFYGTGDQLYMNPGLARNFEYDSALISTSLGNAFLPKSIDDQLHWNTLKLPLSDGNGYQIARLLETILEQKQAKNIFYLFHYSSFLHDDPGKREDVPEYLYNESIWDDYKYLMNLEVIFSAVPKILVSNILGKQTSRLDFDHIWMESHAIIVEPVNEPPADAVIREPLYSRGEKQLMYERFDELFLNSLNTEGQVEFYMVFPPFHMNYYCNTKKLDALLSIQHHVVEATAHLDNVRIYNLQLMDEISENRQYYPGDNFHFSTAAASKFIKEISHNAYRVNSSKEYTMQMEKLKSAAATFCSQNQ